MDIYDETYDQRLIRDAQDRGMSSIQQICKYRVELKRELRKKEILYDKFATTEKLEELNELKESDNAFAFLGFI